MGTTTNSESKLQNTCNGMEELLRTVTEFSVRMNLLCCTIDKLGDAFTTPPKKAISNSAPSDREQRAFVQYETKIQTQIPNAAYETLTLNENPFTY